MPSVAMVAMTQIGAITNRPTSDEDPLAEELAAERKAAHLGPQANATRSTRERQRRNQATTMASATTVTTFTAALTE